VLAAGLLLAEADGAVEVLVLSMMLVPLVVIALALILTLTVVGTVRRRFAGPPPVAVPPAAPAWGAARERFAELAAGYAAHECDPMAVLRLPALSDVGVGSTARFVDAFARAQALETDEEPDAAHAAAFVAAVGTAERAWRAAVDAAERIRLSGLAPGERAAVERAVKLLTTARDSDSDAERLAAYSRARAELDKLDRLGAVHLPRPARTVLDAAARGELPG